MKIQNPLATNLMQPPKKVTAAIGAAVGFAVIDVFAVDKTADLVA